MKTLSDQQIHEEADKLHYAESSGLQMDAMTFLYPEMTIIDAYHIQDELVRLKIEEGQKIIGHKIGLTSKVMQRAFNINEPDFGVLFNRMVHESGAMLKRNDYIEPRIEVELAFMFKADVPHSCDSHEELMSLVDYVIPALELIDFRMKPQSGEDQHQRTVKDTISDNAANAAIILGDTKIPLDTDLSWVGATLSKNSVIQDTGVSAAVLGSPLNSILWLNKKYAEYGRQIKAGELVLAGSFTSPIPVLAGDVITANYNEFGKINCSFN